MRNPPQRSNLIIMGTPSDPDPFRNLYKANHERVRSLLARMVGPQDAEDLAQTAFAKAAKALPSFRGEAQGSTWLYRIAVNVASDWLRSRAVHEYKLTEFASQYTWGGCTRRAAGRGGYRRRCDARTGTRQQGHECMHSR